MGLSFNTLGQIKRFDGDLSAATGAYSEALEIFRKENAFIWQIRALHSRGEAHRRIATILYEQERNKARKEFEELARKDINECINLCIQHNIDAVDLFDFENCYAPAICDTWDPLVESASVARRRLKM